MDYGRLVFMIFVLMLIILTGLTLVLYYKDKIRVSRPSIITPVGPASPNYFIDSFQA